MQTGGFQDAREKKKKIVSGVINTCQRYTDV
jgi:hypothetical protein